MSKSSKTKAVAKRMEANPSGPLGRPSKRAPGNAKALQDKAADNVSRINKQKGRVEAIAKSMPLQSGGTGVAVITTRDRTVVVSRMDATTTKLIKVGEPIAKLEEYLRTQPKPQAKLANGVDSRTAPQSAKAVADQRRGEKTAPAPKGKAAAKAPKAAKAKAGADYSYRPTKKANDAKPNSLRGRMLKVIMAHKDTASAKAAAEKAKLTGLNSGWFNWAAANGYITK